MKISIVASQDTVPESIERLIAEVPGIFPKELELQVADSGIRYTLKKENIALHDFSDEFCDGFGDEDMFAYNIWPIIFNYRQEHQGDVLMILMHENFANNGPECSPIPCIAGPTPTGDAYGGLVDKDRLAVIVGAPNEAHENNLKVAGHELFHLFLDRPSRAWGEVGQVLHCEGYVEQQRCIMHQPPNLHPTGETMAQVATSFCTPCYQKLTDNQQYILQLVH